MLDNYNHETLCTDYRKSTLFSRESRVRELEHTFRKTYNSNLSIHFPSVSTKVLILFSCLVWASPGHPLDPLGSPLIWEGAPNYK